jgi:hypothetical protein
MKIKFSSLSSAAVLCAVVLALTSTIQAGPLSGGFRGIDGGTSRANRGHRMDDPANHDARDDRGGHEPGDDRGRHHGRHHRGADDPVNHDARDDRGGHQPGDDRGRHHGRGRY